MFDRDVKRQMSRRLVGLSNETGRLRPAGPPQADLSARHLCRVGHPAARSVGRGDSEDIRRYVAETESEGLSL